MKWCLTTLNTAATSIGINCVSCDVQANHLHVISYLLVALHDHIRPFVGYIVVDDGQNVTSGATVMCDVHV